MQKTRDTVKTRDSALGLSGLVSFIWRGYLWGGHIYGGGAYPERKKICQLDCIIKVNFKAILVN